MGETVELLIAEVVQHLESDSRSVPLLERFRGQVLEVLQGLDGVVYVGDGLVDDVVGGFAIQEALSQVLNLAFRDYLVWRDRQ